MKHPQQNSVMPALITTCPLNFFRLIEQRRTSILIMELYLLPAVLKFMNVKQKFYMKGQSQEQLFNILKMMQRPLMLKKKM